MSRPKKTCCFLLAFAGLYFMSACDDNSANPDLVTVSGTVRDIDTGANAVGVRISLFETPYADEVATGTDGAFSIQIPKGSKLMLYADDFADGADVWFPLINVDYPPVIVTEDITDWPTHACPRSVAPNRGTVAVLDNYLANGDASNGDLFVPTTSASADGIITLLILGGAAGQSIPSADFSVAVDAPEFPEGYGIGANIFDAEFVPNPSLGPNCFYPASRTTTDDSGMFASFAGPAFTGTDVMLTVTDANSARGLAWIGALPVPIRPGTISMLLPCYLDGVPNVPLQQFGNALGLF